MCVGLGTVRDTVFAWAEHIVNRPLPAVHGWIAGRLRRATGREGAMSYRSSRWRDHASRSRAGRVGIRQFGSSGRDARDAKQASWDC